MQDKNVVVIYKTKYGSSKKYAEWIAEELNSDLFEASKIKPNDLLKYDTIVYGGSLYAVGILGLSLIKKNFDKLKDKKLIVFSVGASTGNSKALEEVRNKNFTEEMKEKVHYFHLRGALKYSKFKPFDRFLMFLLKSMVGRKKPSERDEDEKGILATYGRDIDFTNKRNIAPIIDCVKGSQ